MTIWKKLFGGNKTDLSQKIKKEVKYKNLIIKLYEYSPYEPSKKESNIEAFDLEGNFLWRAENCPQGRFYEMQIDEGKNNLNANDGGGMYYTIDLKNGKILTERLIK